MQFTAVLRTINEMKQAGVIDHYAIGGAVGATFYLEPIATLDIDIFVNFATVPGQLLASPRPIFDFMLARGAVAKGEYLIVEGWPVQFLPPPSLLCEEAVSRTMITDMLTILKSKQSLRAELASLPIERKLELLESMRDRQLAINSSLDVLNPSGHENEAPQK